MDQLIKIFMRRLSRQLVNKSISAGLGAVSKRGGDSSEQTPKQDTKRVRQAMRVLRRTSRF